MRVEVWFQDEARIGQKNSLTRVWGQTGSRPAAPKDLGFASAYMFGAVCPSEGKAAALIMPICNTLAMNHHLREISSQVSTAAHAVVILDRAGWHRSQGLVVPDNITLLELPPYSPELNPVERIWHYLRSHWLANSVFTTDEQLDAAIALLGRRQAHLLSATSILTPSGRVQSGLQTPRDWFVADSALEGNGFEPSVPRHEIKVWKGICDSRRSPRRPVDAAVLVASDHIRAEVVVKAPTPTYASRPALHPWWPPTPPMAPGSSRQ